MEDQIQTPPVPPETTPPATAPRTSGMAIAAFILAFLFPPAGLILGIVALIQISSSRGLLRGNGLAIASVIIAPLMLFIILPAAILFPVFARARERAQMTSCATNVKQLCIAMSMYSSDWDDCYPQAGDWNRKLYPYIKNPRVLHCPSDKTGGPSYAMNAVLSGKPESAVTYTAETVMLFESKPGANRAGGRELLPEPPRHQDGYNIGFADGHVMFARRESLGPLRWDLSP